MLRVILGSFGVFSIFNSLVSRNWQVLERKKLVNLYVVQFDVVIVGHLVNRSVKAPGLLVFFTAVQGSYEKRKRCFSWQSRDVYSKILKS